MNQTSNYGFNVPVGADIVNPLVQDFPNWTSLDTILRNIANTGITTATHTKAGTIHTLTFSETTVPMIRFQATADFNTNDTFTVNGLSVSALTVSGEALPDGAFVIGSMVLCELRDNLLTVYSSGADASTLDGHPASYFATASDLQTVDGKTDANKVLIDQINSYLSWKNITGLNVVCDATTNAETRYVNTDLVGATELEIHFSDSSIIIPVICGPNNIGIGNLNTTIPTSAGKFVGDNFWNFNVRARFISSTGELYIAFLFQGASRSNSETIQSINYR